MMRKSSKVSVDKYKQYADNNHISDLIVIDNAGEEK